LPDARLANRHSSNRHSYKHGLHAHAQEQLFLARTALAWPRDGG
jgi:hypothetical protein